MKRKANAVRVRNATYVDDFLFGSETIDYDIDLNENLQCLFIPFKIGHQKIGPSYFNQTVNQDFITIQLTLSGAGLFTYCGQTETLHEGDLVFCNSFVEHSFEAIPENNWEILFIHIYDNSALTRLNNMFNRYVGAVLNNFPKTIFDQYYKEIKCLIQNEGDDSLFKISSLTYQFILNIVSFAKSNKKEVINSPLVSNIISYITREYMSEIKLSDVLNYVSYSKTHAERLFKQETGYTIQQYINLVRFQKAQDLLISSQLSIKEVASKVGYSEYRTMYYAFMGKYNLTPTQYRQKYKKTL